jgi:hypothetical protein
MNKLVLGIAVAVGLVAAGLGLAGVAAAAPTTPSAASSAPASAAPAPAPVPLVYQPVDTDDFYGVERGSVPTASTSSLAQVPVLNRLPAVDVTPFPAKADADEGDEADDASAGDTAGDEAGDEAATDESAASDTGTSPAP